MRLLRSLVVQVLAYALVILTLIGMYAASIHYHYTATQPNAQYFAEKVHLKRFDTQGHLDLDLQANQLIERSDQQQVDLTAIEGTLIPNQQSQWQLQSQKAQLIKAKKQLKLQGKVLLQRSPQPLAFETEELIIDFKQQTISSQKPVLVTQGKTQTHAHSVRYDLKTHALALQ